MNPGPLAYLKAQRRDGERVGDIVQVLWCLVVQMTVEPFCHRVEDREQGIAMNYT